MLKKKIHTHGNEKTLSIEGLAGFRRGQQTSSIYSLNAQKIPYNDSYFLDEYKQQYGLTYLEDEQNLRRSFQGRLEAIQKFKKAPARLLEIGCATGFFLDEAKKCGYQTYGCEVSSFASEYARSKFKINVINSDFLKIPEETFDIIVACYTLEHFQNQVKVFKKISDMLSVGGLLFFSLPSTNGPMWEFDQTQWAHTHPKDHFCDYDPKSIKRVLQKYNLHLRMIEPASYHQNRCRSWKKIIPKSLYKSYASIFNYADTMNGCAIKY